MTGNELHEKEQVTAGYRGDFELAISYRALHFGSITHSDHPRFVMSLEEARAIVADARDSYRKTGGYIPHLTASKWNGRTYVPDEELTDRLFRMCLF
ncbi:MAG: hypothetical protein HYW25_06220 [Candidatus Aenigmarchaeota archaeon]|nr:hypothetical protein [Candidatus Aenigmarchaeota archaeon]